MLCEDPKTSVKGFGRVRSDPRVHLCDFRLCRDVNQPLFLFDSPPLTVLSFLKLGSWRAVRSDVLLILISFDQLLPEPYRVSIPQKKQIHM